MTHTINAIAFVAGGRAEPKDDHWGDVISSIELAEGYDETSLSGLNDFSHVEVVYIFDRVSEDKIERGARHPRGRTDWPLVGIFAQRGKNRPNRIGVTIAEIIELKGRTLKVRGLDAVDGTPVIDIKPLMRGFLPRREVREPAWSIELMKDYW